MSGFMRSEAAAHYFSIRDGEYEQVTRRLAIAKAVQDLGPQLQFVGAEPLPTPDLVQGWL